VFLSWLSSAFCCASACVSIPSVVACARGRARTESDGNAPGSAARALGRGVLAFLRPSTVVEYSSLLKRDPSAAGVSHGLRSLFPHGLSLRAIHKHLERSGGARRVVRTRSRALARRVQSQCESEPASWGMASRVHILRRRARRPRPYTPRYYKHASRRPCAPPQSSEATKILGPSEGS
jgi:hypothetical protein